MADPISNFLRKKVIIRKIKSRTRMVRLLQRLETIYGRDYSKQIARQQDEVDALLDDLVERSYERPNK